MFCVRQGNPTKHMRIQDTFHPDGISYESGDELSETESDLRSSQEKLNGNGTFSPPSKESHGKIGLTDFFSYQFLLVDNRSSMKKYTVNSSSPHVLANVLCL